MRQAVVPDESSLLGVAEAGAVQAVHSDPAISPGVCREELIATILHYYSSLY
jgi:hypothetical protein